MTNQSVWIVQIALKKMIDDKRWQTHHVSALQKLIVGYAVTILPIKQDSTDAREDDILKFKCLTWIQRSNAWKLRFILESD